MRRLAALALLWASPLCAQAQLGDPLAQITADLNGNGVTETYSLVRGLNDSANFVVQGDPAVDVTVPSLVWTGIMSGTEPSLEIAPNGSLWITEGNHAIGRSRWEQVLTVAFRNGQLTLAGLTYTWYDTLDPEDNGICDINLLTGQGFLDQGKGVRIEVRDTDNIALPISDWSYTRLIPACAPEPAGG